MVTVREGSAKNTYIGTPTTDSLMGSGHFYWTNDWSIFDVKELGIKFWPVPYQDVALPAILRITYEILHSQSV